MVFLVGVNYYFRLSYRPWAETIVEYYSLVSNNGLFDALFKSWEGYIPAFPVFSAQAGVLLGLSPDQFATFTVVLASVSVGVVSSLNGYIMAKFIGVTKNFGRKALIFFFILAQNVMFLHPSLSSISSLGYIFATPAITLLLVDYFGREKSFKVRSLLDRKRRNVGLPEVVYSLLLIALLSKTNLIFLSVCIYILFKISIKLGLIATLIQLIQMSQITSYNYPDLLSIRFILNVGETIIKLIHFGLDTLFNSQLFSVLFLAIFAIGIVITFFTRMNVKYLIPLILSLLMGALPWLVDGNSIETSSISRLKMQHFVLPTFIMLFYLVYIIVWSFNQKSTKRSNSLLAVLSLFLIVFLGTTNYQVNRDIEATGFKTDGRCKLYPPLPGWSREVSTEVRSSIWSNCAAALKFQKFSMSDNMIVGFEGQSKPLKEIQDAGIPVEKLILMITDQTGSLEGCNRLLVTIPDTSIGRIYDASEFQKSQSSGLYYIEIQDRRMLDGNFSEIRVKSCMSILEPSRVGMIALY